MLRSVYIDGLRSLKEFELKLQPGLNVLVGPNGSGKSNILTAFELISRLSLLELPGTNGLFQGTQNEIASLFDLNSEKKKILIKLNGEVESPSRTDILIKSTEVQRHKVCYKYECGIEFKFNQEIKLEFSHQNMELRTDPENEKESVKRVRIEYDTIGIRIPEFDEFYWGNFDQRFDQNQIESYFNMNKDAFRYRSLLFEFRQLIIPMTFILQELNSCGCFNIDPNLTRINLQQPVFPNLSQQGVGLSHALYSIFEDKDKDGVNEISRSVPDLNFKDVYNKIICYFKQLMPEIDNLNVSYNNKLNIIETDVTFKNGKSVPLIYMSDGTLKLLSLLVDLLTSKHMFVIEEPENYLHPKMQSLFTELMRNSLNYRQSNGVFSTHSESFINALDPSEVVLTNFREGRTVVSRIDNMEDLRKSLQDTGFGLSWYYVTGALD